MNKGLRKFLILLVIFVSALFGFSNLTNHETTDLTTDMKAATMPVLYFLQDGKPMNELHGYVREMDAVSMRDTITPLSEDGVLPVQIDTYGKEISGITFEVRSLDTSRLVQNTQAEDFHTTENRMEGNLQIQDLLEDGQEYLMIVKLETAGKETYYYYTRIIRETQSHIQECIDFVEEFHEITMDKERQSELSSYMEPSSAGDNETLQKVTINSSLEQACWADFVGQEVTEPVVSVKELNDAYHVILLNYIMSSVDETGASEYYNVEEYYRVRVGAEKTYLLSFERTMEEIFRGENNRAQQNYINLGIRTNEVDFKADETGNVICFVQQGELWSYNLSDNKLTQVFSFRSLEGMDVRENYSEHDIRIIRADEGGSLSFIVYGYMNRGDHEGQVGVSVCYYDRVTNTVEEQLFIPFTISYQIMKEEIGELMYISDGGMFYLTVGDQVHQINLNTMEDIIFVSGLKEGNYTCSEEGRYLAWVEGDGHGLAETMRLADLETAQIYEVPAENGMYIKPLGFIGTDCIYGLADKEDVGASANAVLMSRVEIIDSADSSHPVLKTYENADSFVTGIRVEDGSIYLSRVKKDEGGYSEIAQDTIRNRDMQEEASVYVSEIQTDIKQRQVILQLSKNIPEKTVKMIVPKQIIPEKDTVLDLKEYEISKAYYVYAKGKVLFGGNDVADAIRVADENRGVVIGSGQAYVWKRGKKQVQQPLAVKGAKEGSSTAQALSAMITMTGNSADAKKLLKDGKSPYEILQDAVQDRHVYDLTGCKLEHTLYFVGLGIPVYAEVDGRAALVTGYDDNYVWIYDMAAQRASSRLIVSASEEFAEGKSVFLAIGE